MAGVQFTEVPARPTEFLDCTSYAPLCTRPQRAAAARPRAARSTA
jgi:hypothetical protein